jgi:hypothetical protein
MASFDAGTASRTRPQEDDLAMDDDDVLDLSGGVIGDQPEELTGRERRLTIRAYNFWEGLLHGRPYPSVADLQPDAMDAFRDVSILLDFTADLDRPVLRYVGKALRDECGLTLSTAHPEDVPGRSLLSRLTDHYLEIIANRAPIGFEAEFHNLRGNLAMYRGILMPLSDDGSTINYIFGVISWKEVVSSVRDFAGMDDDAAALTLGDIDDDEAGELLLEPAQSADEEADDALLLDEPMAASGASAADDPVDQLHDLLASARDAAESVKATEGRSRAALYDALAQVYRFQAAASAAPASYAEVLAEAGLEWQERAPYTPMVKLVFGATYDKTRLAEYAAAISHGAREDIPVSAFRGYLDRIDGGLKALVKAERAERAHARGNRQVDRAARARERLAATTPLASLPDPGGDGDFVLLLGRRSGGKIDIVAVAQEPQAMIDGILRRLPKR